MSEPAKPLPQERCCQCDEPTGRAGRGDDSIYMDVDGKEIGPLCPECADDIMFDE